MITITLDCGASFIKCARFEDNKCIKRIENSAQAVNKFDPLNPVQGATHVDNIVNMARDMINALVGEDKEIFLAISNEMHGFLLVDEQDNLLTDYISWQHEYGHKKIDGDSSYELLSSDISLEEDILHTGMKLRGGLPSCNLYYLSKYNLLQKSSSGVYFYTLGDYILYRLAQRKVLCHPTNAAATGLFDICIGAWNKKLINYISPVPIILPDIEEKEISFSLNGIRIHAFPAIGDQQAALLGAGLEKSDILSFNIGTGAQVSTLMKNIKLSYEYQTRPYFNGCYLKTIPHIPSGRAINVYIRFIRDVLLRFGINKSDSEIWQVVLNSCNHDKETSMICDMSFFDNTITSNTTGSISNIGEYDLNLGTLFLAIFKAMSENFIQTGLKLTGKEQIFNTVLFSGGFARKAIPLREAIAKEYSGKEIVVSESDTLHGLDKYISSCLKNSY